MDFDRDGVQDIVSGGYMGVPFFIKGTADGFAAPVVLKDKEGGHLETGRFWNPDKKRHTEGKAPDGAKGDRAYAALAIDWDDDGDLDLLRGTSNGSLFLRENEGTPKAHAYATTTRAVKIGGEPAMVPGGYAYPVAADWDGDGLWDLVSGNEDGEVYWFKNTGKKGNPALAKPERLVGSPKTENLGRGDHAQVDVCDWDGDGDLDLLVGDCHMKYDKDTGFDTHGYVWLFRRAAK